MPAAQPAHAPPPVYGAPQPPIAAPPAAPPIETVYRILMPDFRVGGLIGKGGEVGCRGVCLLLWRQEVT